MDTTLRELILSWYSLLNTAFAALQGPLGGLTSGGDTTLVTALLLGILGATSPCQLSTNASSIAYMLQGASHGERAIGWTATAFVAGKVLMYSGIGVLAALMGQGLQAAAIPAVVVARKALGPLMILIALGMLGAWRSRLSLGHHLSHRLREHVGGSGTLNAFLLGVAFSFAFCPTLALLFFGYVIPMSVASAAGPLYPGAFALGTTVPLIMTATAFTVGLDAKAFTQRLPTWEPWLRRVAGVIFLLAGINDTLLYWFL